MDKCKICGSECSVKIKNIFDDRYGYPKSYNILKCKKCGLFQTDPPLLKSEVEDLYSNFYERKNIKSDKIITRTTPENYWTKFKNWLEGNHKIQFLLPNSKSNHKILDVGCGEGRSLVTLKEKGYDAYGAETDRNVEKIKKELNLNIHIGTIEKAPWPAKTFDYIIANQLLEHIIDLDSFLSAVSKLLKDNGVFILSTPNGKSLFRRIYGRKWIHWHIPYHQQIFNNKNIDIILKKHGFYIHRRKTVSPTSWSIHELNRLKFNPSLGQKNPFWVKNEQKNPATKEKTKTNLTKKAKGVVYDMIFFGLSVFNRFVDLFRQGNCLIVFASKKQ